MENRKRKDYYFLTIYDPGLIDYLEGKWKGEYEIVGYNKLVKGEYNCCGVWALFGKSKETKQTDNMAREFKTNLRIMKNRKNLMKPQIYINQWGEDLGFKHPRHLKTAGMWAYTHIPKKYSNRVWIVISHGKDVKERAKIERDFAELFHALYWRNGGGNQRKNDNCNECKTSDN